MRKATQIQDKQTDRGDVYGPTYTETPTPSSSHPFITIITFPGSKLTSVSAPEEKQMSITNMSTSGLVQATSPTDGVRLITFNRPEKRNALSRQLLDEFLTELRHASTDPAVHAIVISGNGTFFSGEPLQLLCLHHLLISLTSLIPLHLVTLAFSISNYNQTFGTFSCSRCRSQRYCRP